ncbi:MAG: cupredoxin domain-containing protein [Polyangiales bacterium]
MAETLHTSSRPASGRLALIACAAALLCAPQIDAAMVTDKTPGIDAPGTTKAGTADFLFAHNFSVVGTSEKVINSPTFLLDFGILPWASIGARYASRSTVSTRPNELEVLGKIWALSETRGQPLDVTVLGGYDTAANSGVGEILLGRELGPIGLLGALRGFTAGFAYGGATAAAALGARIRLTRYFYLVGDVSHVLGAHKWSLIKDQSNKFGWTGGIAFQIPYSPHSVSLYVTNLNSHTTMESSRGGINTWLMGFEFDVPFGSAKRWAAIFTTPPTKAQPAQAPAPAGAAEGKVVEVDMKDMNYSPAKLTIPAGTTVKWTNHDSMEHTVTSGDGSWDSGTIEAGGTFTHRFDKPGHYPIECTFHVDMTGEIIVEPKPAGTP